MPLLKKIQTVAAKVESTVGTAESLTNSEGAFNAYDVAINPEIEVEDREGQGSFNRLAGVPGARGGTMTFKTDIEYDGTTTMPSWASVLFPGCGVVESSQVYTPRSEALGSNVKTLTLASYIDGVKKMLKGAVGNAVIHCPSGKKCYIDWTWMGVWVAPADVAILAPTYPTDTVVRFAAATTTFASVDLCVSELTLDFGNEMILRECPDDVSGYVSGLIVDRVPKLTADPEATLVATDDPYGDLLAGTTGAFSSALDGPAPVTTTSQITIAAPAAQITTIAEGERNKLATDEIEWTCTKNGATHDQEFSITFAESTA